jgi:hypothetical protein
MSTRMRTWVYGVFAALVVASGLPWLLIHGVVGQAIAIALVTAGLFGAFTFWFVELGMDEERERVDEHERRLARAVAEHKKPPDHATRPRPQRWRRRPG